MSFVHLHLHSEYSLLSSTCRIPKIMEKAKELGMPAVACTDNGAMYDIFKFFIAAKDAGIKPILGVDFYKAAKSRHDRPDGVNSDQDRVVILAKNLNGYKNLMKLVTAAHMEGIHYKPRIDFELLERHREDLIVLSGSLNGEIAQLILHNKTSKARDVVRRYAELFEGNFYLELQRHPGLDDQELVNRELLAISKDFGIPVVATSDVHYLNPDDAYAQEVLLCIQTGRAIFERDRPLTMVDTPSYYFKSADEMKELFADIPEAIDNTVKIADQINIDLEYGKFILPGYDIPSGMTPADYLRKMTYDRRSRVQGFSDKEICERIDYELSVISEKGYDNYFLITQDFVNWAKQNGIAVGPGRGSAAGSLVSYILRITDINPLEYKLPFERFLNPGRPSPPDIDIDFADVRRDEVLNYVSKKYGSDKVAQIITFGTMEAKMAVRDVARALGMSYSQGDRIAKMIPAGKQGFNVTISQALEESPQLKQAYVNEEDVKNVVDVTKKVEKLPRHSSVHAAGVIISNKPMTEYVPLQRDEKGGRTITQFDMYCLDLNAVSEDKAVGLLKFDFLGLRNLTIIENAIEAIEKRHNTRINISDVPLDNKAAYELIGRGETIGVFQLESPGMRRLAKDLQPERMTDVTAMVALYRPGPMDLIPTFIKGKKNPKTVKYLHADLKSIMGETYGVLVYQEQVMEIANKLAGYDMGRADNLRRAMGKKKKSVMEKERKLFVEGCVANGYQKRMAEEIYTFIEKFAAYGFNKPHSACYALIAYWTAFLKANYPVEFMTALLNAEQHGAAGPIKEQKMAQAVGECKRMKITILPPSINSSQRNFAIEEDNIRFGLSGIKNVGDSAIDSILAARDEKPFEGFTDFLKRVDLRKVNKKTVENLIKAGAFDSFSNKKTLLENYPQLIKDIAANKDQVEKGQYGLFFEQDVERTKGDTFAQLEEYSETDLIVMEKEVLGFLVTKNPLDRFRKVIEEKVSKNLSEVNLEDNKKQYIFAGVVNSVKVVKTKKDNSDMAFLSISDDSGSMEVTVFPKVYRKLRALMEPNKIILLKASVSNRNDELSLLLDNAIDLEMAVIAS